MKKYYTTKNKWGEMKKYYMAKTEWKELEDMRKVGQVEMFFAKLLGKKFIVKDSGHELTMYKRRGKTYVTRAKADPFFKCNCPNPKEIIYDEAMFLSDKE